MFEETKPIVNNSEPKDIFQEIEPVAQANPAPQPVSQPIAQPIAPPPAVGGVAQGMGGGPKEPLANLSQLTTPPKSRFWLWLIILVITAVLVAAGWYAYARFFNQPAVPVDLPITNQPEGGLLPEQPATTSLEEPATTTPALEEAPTSTEATIDPATIDTDGDGLPDVQEQALGIDPGNPDTDVDGLTDREEVIVYQTNPLNKDTDGDGYMDGDEVKNNYDPKGPGRLRDLQKALQNSTTANQLP